jgi:hypothetical protein
LLVQNYAPLSFWIEIRREEIKMDLELNKMDGGSLQALVDINYRKILNDSEEEEEANA